MPLSVDQLRADTPECEGQVFLDNAGSALSPSVVNQAILDHLQLEQKVGGYAAEEEARPALEALKSDLGTLTGTEPHQVAFATSATPAYHRALSSVPLGKGDRVLISSAEYGNNLLHLLQLRDRLGFTLEIIPDGEDGAASPEAFAEMLDGRVNLLVLTHAPSQNGLVVDATAFGRILAEQDHPAWFLLDTCQSIGQLPVDLEYIGADFVIGTGRKWLRGPRGTGFLATSQRVLDELEPVPVELFGASLTKDGYVLNPDASRFSSFELPYASLLGLGAAVRYALDLGINNIFARIQELATSLRSKLSEQDQVRVLDRGTVQSGIVTFSVPGNDATERALQLRDLGIAVTPVLTSVNPTDVARMDAPCILRASPHVYNTESELDQLVDAVGRFS